MQLRHKNRVLCDKNTDAIEAYCQFHPLPIMIELLIAIQNELDISLVFLRNQCPPETWSQILVVSCKALVFSLIFKHS